MCATHQLDFQDCLLGVRNPLAHGLQSRCSLIIELILSSSESVHASAGSFFSAAFENTCIAVVGASGGVFGVVGLFIADMIMNFVTIHRQAAFRVQSRY